MDTFQLTEEQVAIRDLAAKLAESFEEPTERWDRDGAFDRAFVAEVVREGGLCGMTLPAEYGGLGLGYLEFILALEQFARISYPAAFFLASTCSGPIDFLLQFGSERVKQTFLPPLVSGEQLCAVAISEPEAGSDVGNIRTRAVIEGDTIRINGSKSWVGGGGDWDSYVVFARLSDAPGVAGLGCLVVPKGAPGLSFGSRFNLMGTRPIPRSEIVFEDCRVPADNLLTEPGSFASMIEIFNGERIHNACLGLGIAQGAYEAAAEYANQRVQFGQRIVDFQGTQWKLAEMETLLEACRQLVYRAARAKDAGVALGRIVSQAKLFCASYMPAVCEQALQIQGATGYAEGSRVERAFRDVRALVCVGGGTTEMMKNYLGRLHRT